jgi:hypothetical protein
MVFLKVLFAVGLLLTVTGTGRVAFQVLKASESKPVAGSPYIGVAGVAFGVALLLAARHLAGDQMDLLANSLNIPIYDLLIRRF